jgi:type IV secretory pathway VirB10-like protein
MTPELERTSRALVALASAACVSWWLWPSGAEERREPPRELATAPLELPEIVPITPVAPEPEMPQAPEPAAAPPPPLPARAAAPPLPTITATAKAAPRPSLPVLQSTGKRGELSAGRLPKLKADGRRIGFIAYRDAMLALGGGFFLYDALAKRPFAEIDPVTGEVRSETLRSGLSDWPRDMTSLFEAALELGRKRYGARASRVVLLPPAHIDTTLVTALRRELPLLGVDPDAVVRVDLVYELRDGRLECDVVGVGLRDAGDRTLELRVTLSDPIPGLSYQTSREEMQHA